MKCFIAIAIIYVFISTYLTFLNRISFFAHCPFFYLGKLLLFLKSLNTIFCQLKFAVKEIYSFDNQIAAAIVQMHKCQIDYFYKKMQGFFPFNHY